MLFLRIHLPRPGSQLVTTRPRRQRKPLVKRAAQAEINAQSADTVIKAVSLQCGGHPYNDCADIDAKAKYDRALYDANAAYTKALAASSEARTDLTKAEEARDLLDAQLLEFY